MCAFLLSLLLVACLSRAQEDPKTVYLWWEHKDRGHSDLVHRLRAYSQKLISARHSSSSSSPSSPPPSQSPEGEDNDNPLIEAFERTNTHAFVLLGPHRIRAENVRNFSRALGFTESGGKYLTKVPSVLRGLNLVEKEELIANSTVHRNAGSGWVGRYMMLKALMNTLQHFLSTNYTNALVLEDDIMKVDAFSWPEVKALLADMITLDPQDWDILFPGHCYAEIFPFHYKRNVLLKRPNSSDIYYRALNAFCTHAVVYNRVAAEIFLNNWMPFREAVDSLLAEIICKFGLKGVRPVISFLHQDRTLTKSGTGNYDPLFPLRSKKNYVKWAQCHAMLNVTNARMYGLDGISSVPPIYLKGDKKKGYSKVDFNFNSTL